jgi:cell division protein FtsQ
MAFVLASAAIRRRARRSCAGHAGAELRDGATPAPTRWDFASHRIALAGQRQLHARRNPGAAGVTGRTSLLFLDVADARARLKANPWIADATVLKLYPGRLQI